MTIAITTKLFLNGSWLKDMIVRNDMGEIVIEVIPNNWPIRTDRPYPCMPLPMISFQQSYYTPTNFYAWGVPKEMEALLRAAEEKLKKKDKL